MSSWANRHLIRKRDFSTLLPPVNLVSKPVNEIVYPSLPAVPLPVAPIPVVPSPSINHKQKSSSPLIHLYNKDISYLDTYEHTVERIRLFSSLHSDALITFIIPSINRASLLRTLDSIRQQTNQRWKAIVLFDGCEPTDDSTLEILQDSRILHLSINKKGVLLSNQSGQAGHIRNIGMSMVTTPWIGFVDDDDMILPNYIEKLLEESGTLPHADLISFRMIDMDRLVPPPLCQSIIPNQIGISFAIKTSLYKDGFLFTQSVKEDYHFVKDVYRAKKIIVLSSHVTYLTRDSIYKEHSKIMRIVLRLK